MERERSHLGRAHTYIMDARLCVCVFVLVNLCMSVSLNRSQINHQYMYALYIDEAILYVEQQSVT